MESTLSQKIIAQFKPSSNVAEEVARSSSSADEKDSEQQPPTSDFGATPAAASGVATIEALQAVWGKHGKYALWAG
jgi:hypothetical protein